MATPGERFDRMSEGQAYKPASRALDPRTIVVETGWNVRDMTSPDTREHIAALKLSILARGVDKAITVRYDRKTGTTTLVDGQCRLTACRELVDEGHKIFVPAICVEGDEAELTAESLTSNTGHPLTQWEIGAGCRRLLKYGWSPATIAQHICKSLRYVNEAIALSNVSLEAKSMLAAGEVTPGAVLHAVKAHGDAATTVLREQVTEAYRRAPEPPQAPLEGIPAKQKPRPVARPKAPSTAEKATAQNRSALDLADAFYRLYWDTGVDASEVDAAAKEYGKARGL